MMNEIYKTEKNTHTTHTHIHTHHTHTHTHIHTLGGSTNISVSRTELSYNQGQLVDSFNEFNHNTILRLTCKFSPYLPL
jgi:hypothetical protein